MGRNEGVRLNTFAYIAFNKLKKTFYLIFMKSRLAEFVRFVVFKDIFKS